MLRMHAPSSGLARWAQRLPAISLEGELGDWLIADKFGRKFCRIPDVLDTVTQERVERFVHEANALPRAPQLRITLNITDVALRDHQGRSTALVLTRDLLSLGLFHVRIHLTNSIDSYVPDLLAFLLALTDIKADGRRRTVSIESPSLLASEETRHSLFARGIRLMAVVSDEHIVNPNGIPGLDDAAQYGFVVPIKWYVTKSNISEIHDAIPNGLHANYNGGFSVAPLLTSPYCTVNEAKSAAPSADEYVALLTRLYQEFEQYDWSFSPVRELAELVLHGGWNVIRGVPTEVNLLVSDALYAFRHVPALALKVATFGEVEAMQPQERMDRLLGFYRSQFDAVTNERCQACSWRFLCGV